MAVRASSLLTGQTTDHGRNLLRVIGMATQDEILTLALTIINDPKVPELRDFRPSDLIIKVIYRFDRETNTQIDMVGKANVYIKGPLASKVHNVLLGLRPDGSKLKVVIREERQPTKDEIKLAEEEMAEKIERTTGKPTDRRKWSFDSDVADLLTKKYGEEFRYDSFIANPNPRITFEEGTINVYRLPASSNILFSFIPPRAPIKITPANLEEIRRLAGTFSSGDRRFPTVAKEENGIKVTFDSETNDAMVALNFMLVSVLGDGKSLIFQPFVSPPRHR